MTTRYILSSNGVDHMTTYTSKAKALETAQAYVWGAKESKSGPHTITVRTEKTGKVIFDETVGSAAEQVSELIDAYHADGNIEEIMAGLRGIDRAITRTYYDNSESIEEVIAGAFSRLGSTQEQEESTETLEEPETGVQGVVEAILTDTGEDYVYETPKTETVCVIQNIPGTNGMNHYHKPGCRDIAREMRRFGMHEDSDVFAAAFSSAASILTHEYDDICEDVAEMVSEANSEYFGIRIMPCLSIPMGDFKGVPLELKNGVWSLGKAVEDSETSYEVDSHTRYPHGRKGPEDTTAETEVFEPGTRVINAVTGERGTVVQPYMTGVIYGIGERMPAVTVEMDNEGLKSALIGDLMLKFKCEMQNGKAIHVAPCADFDDRIGACCEHEDDDLDITRMIEEMKNDPAPGASEETNAISGSMDDAGFMETLVTSEYKLSVVVDENTGATVDLGWVTLTMNTAQAEDHDRIAEEYGRVHGQGTPRHGWASIIRVHSIEAL